MEVGGHSDRIMPTYEFRCKACGAEFTKILTMAERSAGDISCPKCESMEVDQVFSGISVKTDKKTW